MYEHQSNKDKKELINRLYGLKASFPDMSICTPTIAAVLERSIAYGVTSSWNEGVEANLSVLTMV